MKYCKECGRKLKSKAQFCYACGAPCEIDDEALYMERRAAWRRMNETSRKDVQKNTVATVWAVIICVILAAIMFLVWWAPARRAYMYALDGESEAAESLYTASVKDSGFQSFIMRTLVPRGASAIVKAYGSGTLTYEDADARLEELAEFESPLNNASQQREKLETIRTSEEAWNEAQNYEAAGDYRSAMVAYKLVTEDSSHYEEAAAKASDMEGKYKSEVITEVGNPATDAEYQAAVSLLEDALTLLPDDVTLTDKLTSIQQSFASNIKSSTIPVATSYISRGYYKQAIDMVNEALAYNESDQELLRLLDTATKDYETWVQGQVSIYLGNNDKAGALALLERVQKDLPDDAVFKQLYESVRRSA